MDRAEKTKENLLLLLIIATAAVGMILRFDGLLFRSLEYDEVWTYLNYSKIPVAQIFSDLSTPNNHPLSTLFIQWMTGWFGGSFGTIRFPVFLFGVATIVLAALLTWKTVKRKDAVLFSTACIAFNGYLIHYSQTARGYSIQTFFVLLTAVALFRLAKQERSVSAGILFWCSAVCSCLTITSGLIFICALSGAFLVVRFRKTGIRELCRENPVFLISGAAFLLFAGIWYGMNFSRITAGQSFGTSVLNPFEFLKFLFEMNMKLLLFPFVILHIAALFVKKNPAKKISFFVLVFWGLTFLSALVTKAGFDRVYLPVFPVLAVSSAMVIPGILFSFKKESWTLPLFLFLAVLSVLPMEYSRKSQVPPDYIPLMEEIMKDVGLDILVNFTPHDSYPMRYNKPDSARDFLMRLSNPGLKGLLQVNSADGIALYNLQNGSPVVIKSPAGPVQRLESAEGTTLSLYELEPLKDGTETKGKMLLAAILPQPRTLFLTYFQSLADSETWYMSNLFLNSQLFSPGGEPMKSGVYLCPVAKHSASYYLNISRATGLNWRFYIIK